MNRLLLASVLSLISTACGLAAPAANVPRELITCGRERVHILDLNARGADGSPKIIWTWQAAGHPELPKEYVSLFRSTDDCKPVDGGRRILITSSTGGVALVERKDGTVVFYGRAVNAHSADLLPNNRIAVASSRDPRENKGDSLILFDVAQPGRELWRTELPSGHGVVWDDERQLLWALSDTEIRSYRLVDLKSSAPKLERTAVIPLPESGGHEFNPVPGTAMLAVTTSTRCWLFDRDKRALTPHPALGDKAAIKSIAQHPVTGQIAFTEAERPNWWTTRIQFLNPAEICSVTGEQFYKVRWNATRE
jgi:hypothetical protein